MRESLTPPLKNLLWLFIFLFTLLPQAIAADKWVSVRSRNFLLLGNGSEADLRRAAQQLEEFRAAVAMLFPRIDSVSTVHTTVFVFRNDESFRPYKPLVDGMPANLNGFFQTGNGVNYVAITGSLANQSSVLHDYVHSLTRDAIGTLPLWASEGIAEHYSTFEAGTKEGEFTIGKPPSRHMRALAENFLPLDKLFTLSHTSPEYNERTKQGVFYAQSWALTHYFNLSNGGKRHPQFARFLNLLSQERPIAESFSEAFQTDLAVLEKEVREYLRGRTLPQVKLVAQSKVLIDRPVTLSEANAEYHLGDLMFHVDRLPEAETHLKAAITLDPKLAGAYASLGMLNMRKKDFSAAVAYTKKAVETDPKNYLANFYYAYLLQTITTTGEPVATADETDRYEAMRQHLHRTIDEAPNFVDAYGLLAQVNLDASENLKEAEVVLRRALNIAPGRHDLSILLAEAMLRTDQTSAARGLLSTLGRISTDPTVRSRALNLIEQLDLRDTFYKELTGGGQPPTAPAVTPPPASTSTETRREEPRPASRKEPVLEALTPTAPVVEGEQVNGLLILLDCSKGLTLRLQVSNRVIELHSSHPDQIQFLSYTADVSDSIKCGPRNPGTPVKITYRPGLGGTPASIGEPLVVEFLQK